MTLDEFYAKLAEHRAEDWRLTKKGWIRCLQRCPLTAVAHLTGTGRWAEAACALGLSLDDTHTVIFGADNCRSSPEGRASRAKMLEALGFPKEDRR